MKCEHLERSKGVEAEAEAEVVDFRSPCTAATARLVRLVRLP